MLRHMKSSIVEYKFNVFSKSQVNMKRFKKQFYIPKLFLENGDTLGIKTYLKWYRKFFFKSLVVNYIPLLFLMRASFFILCFEEFFGLLGGIMISCLLFIASLVNSNVVYMCCWKDILMLAAWYDHFQYSSDNNLSQNFGFVSASQLLPLVCLCGQGKWIVTVFEYTTFEFLICLR